MYVSSWKQTVEGISSFSQPFNIQLERIFLHWYNSPSEYNCCRWIADTEDNMSNSRQLTKALPKVQ